MCARSRGTNSMGLLHQTKFLLRKNYLTKRRNLKQTLQEVVIPIWWILILFVIKFSVRTKELPAVKDSEIPVATISPQVPVNFGSPGNSSKPIVGYVTNDVPNARQAIDLMKNFSNSAVNFMEFNSTDSMLDYYKDNSESRRFGVGIEFSKGKNVGLAYTLRVSKELFPNTENKLYGLGECHDMTKAFVPGGCPANTYIFGQVATLQASIDAAITKIDSNLPYYVVPNIQAQMMPKDPFTPSVAGFSITASIYMVLAFSPYITVLLVSLVQEKEQKLKELMRIMGMSDTAYWFSWFSTYAIILFFAIIVLNAIMVPAGLLGGSNYVVMVIVFYLYGLSIIMFSFMLTPFFKVAKTAGVVASILTAVLGVIAIPLISADVADAGRWAVSLFSPTAFALAISQAVDNEGLQFSNLATKGDFPPINYIIMLIVDIVLYFLLALYLDAVIPAEYGPRKPPYFIFMPSFWKSLFVGQKGNTLARQRSAREQAEASEDIEAVHADMHGNEAISIHNLRKVFHKKEEIVAVDRVSMDIYEGQVTALLGHNGAGKTTLISLITGMVPASEGYATVYGMDITDHNQMHKIRRLIGVCPQQNVLFDFLTVKEHLEFYSGLKEVAGDATDRMVNQLLKDVDLADQKDTLSKNLSGGQKRKLCVGMALVGDPKVVILDEPTSGMDPYSRRLMWSLLQEKCKDRVVLLTTHFMDEADVLADYKAILSKGKVRCAGTSLFLKNRFGIGYHLTMALADDCSTDRLVELVQSKVQGAEVIRHHGKEMAFALPMEQVACFSDLLKALEANNDGTEGCAAPLLGVTSYGVSMTTLEEVFLQLEDTSEETEGSTDEAEATQGVTVHDTRMGEQHLAPPQEPVTVQDGASRVSGSINALNNAGVELNNAELRGNSQKPVWKAKQQLLGLLKPDPDETTKLLRSVNGFHTTGAELRWSKLTEKSKPSVQKAKQQLLGLLKIRWLNTIRSAAKIFFMVIVPPVLLIVGLSILTRSKNESKTANLPQPLTVTPDVYLKPGSKEDYATYALLQNSTTRVIGHVMGYFTDYNIATKLVPSIRGVLNSSSRDLYNLGFIIRQFPAAFNLSHSSPAGLSSSFLMRYNDTTVHSVPVGVNILGSILHMNALKSLNQTPYPLETTILPFPGLKPEWTFDSTAFTSILLLGMSLAIIPGSFAIEVVALRQEKLRHLLRVSGVSSFVYWLQFFIADAILFLIPCSLLVILVPAFQIPSLTPAPAMGCLVLALLLYFPGGILFSYCCSFMFSKWDTAQQVMPQLYMYGSLIPWFTVALVDMIADPDVAIILHNVFAFLIPPYPVFGSLYYIDRVYRNKTIQAAFHSNGEAVDVHVTASDYFKWTPYNGIPPALIAPVIHAILFCLLVYLLDQRDIGASTKFSCKSSNSNVVDGYPHVKRFDSFHSLESNDVDVKREKEKLIDIHESSNQASLFSVVVKGLWKTFGSGKTAKTVVKDLYFGVEQGEVFGLLGPNGAGKTSSLKMITADFPPTRGKVYVAGYDVSKHPFEAFQRMGYCPQADALWPEITLQEHLELFARIRGVPWGEVKKVVDHYMSALRIAEHAKKKSKDLSGGTKRKVSFANAMLGDPDLLLLDEPSSGMDPSARRFLWNTISKNVKGSRGAILTTHSMEEADALCSRVGIMVKGQLKCLGSTQHLKSTYGSGYTLEIKLTQSQAIQPSSDDPMERLHQYVSELLPGATRSEMFGGRVVYKVPKEGVGALSVIFHKLEKGKEEIGIEEYSFSQSTLEQVFLEFAREQDDDRTGGQENLASESEEDQRGAGGHVSV